MKFVPAKRRLQNIVLSQAMDKVKHRKNMRVLCLPGEESWDFDFFSKYKCISEIVGVEFHPDVARKIQRRKGKKFKVVRKLTSDHLMDESKPYDLIYLDYMSNMGLVVDFDTKIILRRKLVRPGGFLIMNVFGSRASPAAMCPGKIAYSNFCEALGLQEEADPPCQRITRLAWNSIVGINHLVPVSPKGHYVKTSAPIWSAYQTQGGPMFTAVVQVKSYPRTKQEEVLRRHLKQWLASGEYRACKMVEEDRSGL